jgi:hypothetical protein
MKFPKFTIFYADGTTYSGGGDSDEAITLSFSKDFINAPSGGVVAIVAQGSDKPYVLYKEDVYYATPLECVSKGELCQANSFTSLFPFLRDGLGIIKFGLNVADKDHNNIIKVAVEKVRNFDNE